MANANDDNFIATNGLSSNCQNERRREGSFELHHHHTFIVNKLSKTQLNMWQKIIER